MTDRFVEEATLQWLDELTDRGQSAVVVRDPDRHTIWMSPGAEDLLGWPRSVLMDRVYSVIHPDDQGELFYVSREMRAGDLQEGVVHFRFQQPDGSLLPVRARMVNRLGNPDIAGIVVVITPVGSAAFLEDRHTALLAAANDLVVILDRELRMEYVSPSVLHVLGIPPDQLIRRWEELVHPEDRERFELLQREVCDTPGTERRARVRMRHADGDPRTLDVALVHRFGDGMIDGLLVSARDVTEQVLVEDHMRRLTEVLESTTDMVCLFDADYDMLWGNAAATDALGAAPLSRRELLARAPAWARTILEREVLPQLRVGGSWSGELALRNRTGALMPLDATMLTHRGREGGVEFVSVIARDISERKALEARLHEKARHDALTGLPNRVLLMERLDALLGSHQHRIAVVFVDLDHFKGVNDTKGHDAGDRLLAAAAERLRGALRPSDLVARFGGDEFVVLLADVGGAEQAATLAGRVLDHLRGPLHVDELEVYVTGSAGVAVADDGIDAGELIAAADAAMYEAKARGRDQVAVYSAALRERAVERLRTAHDLRTAIDEGELDVWFQPIVDTATGAPVALEALARWHHPIRGPIPPEDFVAVAEETGLILHLGRAVVERTCAALAELGDAGAGLQVSINLSTHQLLDPSLTEVLLEAARRHGIDPANLGCEITETVLMTDVQRSAVVLDGLRSVGIRVAVDDFGTGYSSLAYLHRVPVDALKIDREFVAALSFAVEWDRSLAASIVSLGHALGLRVVAEGVETDEQADILAMLDCDSMQGYRFSPAVPIDRLPAVLDELRRSASAPLAD